MSILSFLKSESVFYWFVTVVFSVLVFVLWSRSIFFVFGVSLIYLVYNDKRDALKIYDSVLKKKGSHNHR